MLEDEKLYTIELRTGQRCQARWMESKKCFRHASGNLLAICTVVEIRIPKTFDECPIVDTLKTYHYNTEDFEVGVYYTLMWSYEGNVVRAAGQWDGSRFIIGEVDGVEFYMDFATCQVALISINGPMKHGTQPRVCGNSSDGPEPIGFNRDGWLLSAGGYYSDFMQKDTR